MKPRKYYFTSQKYHGHDELEFLFQLVMQNVKAAGEQVKITFDENETNDIDANVDIIETSFEDGSGSGSGEGVVRSQRMLSLPNTRQIPFQSNMLIIGKVLAEQSKVVQGETRIIYCMFWAELLS